eukprot:5375568-Prymnesium_polylepis.1
MWNVPPLRWPWLGGAASVLRFHISPRPGRRQQPTWRRASGSRRPRRSWTMWPSACRRACAGGDVYRCAAMCPEPHVPHGREAAPIVQDGTRKRDSTLESAVRSRLSSLDNALDYIQLYGLKTKSAVGVAPAARAPKAKRQNIPSRQRLD